MTDIKHVYVIFFQCLSDIMSDVIRENVGHGVQNIRHVRMSDDFSYTLVLHAKRRVGGPDSMQITFILNGRPLN